VSLVNISANNHIKWTAKPLAIVVPEASMGERFACLLCGR